MPIHATQRNFNAGEIGPLLDSRADLDKWRSGLARCRNFLLTPYGPLRRRMGFKFVAAAKFPDRECRVIGFNASRSQGYCIELGHLYMRFHQYGFPLLVDGDPFEIETPWTEEQIFEVQYESVNDLIFLTHQSVPVQILSYFSTYDWEIAPMAFDWPPLKDENTTSTTLAITSFVNVPVVTTIPFVVTEGAEGITSGSISSSGSRTVVINSMAEDPDPSTGEYLRLEGSTDGGATWVTLQNYTVPGTFAGVYTGLLRLAANFYQVDATLSASVNNPQISAGDIITVSASSPLFTADSVGQYYSMGHERDTTEVRLFLNGIAVSQPIFVRGDWSLNTSGTWNGNIYVERSKDNGQTWEAILNRRSDKDRNIAETGTERETVLLRLRYVGGGDGDRWATLDVSEAIVDGVFQVTEYISPTQIKGVVLVPIFSQETTTIWRAGAWSQTTGYPRCVQWHANRMAFAGTKEQGAAIWFSTIEDYYDFEYRGEDDSAFFKVLGGTQQESIQWLASRSVLSIGTSGGEWIGVSGEEKKIVTPSTFSVEAQSGYGGEAINALLANNTVLFVQATGRKIREFSYVLSDNSYDGADLTQLAIHVTKGGIRDTALQRQRDCNLWATTNNGELIGLIYERAQQVVGWHRHDTQGDFRSVATAYEQGEEDSIYVVARRVINGEEVRYIERGVPNQHELLEDGVLENMPFMDSFTTYEADPTPPDNPFFSFSATAEFSEPYSTARRMVAIFQGQTTGNNEGPTTYGSFTLETEPDHIESIVMAIQQAFQDGVLIQPGNVEIFFISEPVDYPSSTVALDMAYNGETESNTITLPATTAGGTVTSIPGGTVSVFDDGTFTYIPPPPPPEPEDLDPEGEFSADFLELSWNDIDADSYSVSLYLNGSLLRSESVTDPEFSYPKEDFESDAATAGEMRAGEIVAYITSTTGGIESDPEIITCTAPVRPAPDGLVAIAEPPGPFEEYSYDWNEVTSPYDAPYSFWRSMGGSYNVTTPPTIAGGLPGDTWKVGSIDYWRDLSLIQFSPEEILT